MLKINKTRLLVLVLITLILASAAYAQKLPDGSSYRLEYAPSGKPLDLIIEAIDAAKSSILVAAYTFTSKPIAMALLAAYKRGVQVRVVADHKASGSRYSAATFLANQGVPVRTNGRYAIMHHKFMVIDEKHVQTGSFNYSAAAVNKNAENVLLLLNVPELAGQYLSQWQLLWDEGKEVNPSY